MSNKNKNFNLVIVGVGGQGLITLLKIISEATILAGFDIKTSELHGLSQRGGSVEVHARFGEKVFSPLVRQGGADLIIALDTQEAQRACYYGSRQGTIFLINDFFAPVIKGKPLPRKEILKNVEKFSKNSLLIPASRLCQEKVGKSVTAGIFMLSLASFKNIIPLRPELILKAIENVISTKYLEINRKTFDLAKLYLPRIFPEKASAKVATSNKPGP